MNEAKRLTCDEAVRQFFAYLDGGLEGETLQALEKHLEACLNCCDKLEFSRKLDAFVKARLEQERLPEGLEARIRQLIRG